MREREKKKKKRCEGISSSTCGKVAGKEMDVARGVMLSPGRPVYLIRLASTTSY